MTCIKLKRGALLGGLVLTFIAAHALAADRGIDGTACIPIGSGQARCPVLDERPGLEHYDVVQLNVHMTSTTSAGASAAVCVTYWDASGGTCDSTITVTGTGPKTVEINGSAISLWRDAYYQYDFAQIVAGVTSGSGGYIRGLWFTE
jgi:hypothetical protein